VRTGRRGPPVAGGADPSVAMSPDGAYWWDGRQWHDASREVPPAARRSPDGAYWWDGVGWRLVPR
jgi:hypothetical protein